MALGENLGRILLMLQKLNSSYWWPHPFPQMQYSEAYSWVLFWQSGWFDHWSFLGHFQPIIAIDPMLGNVLLWRVSSCSTYCCCLFIYVPQTVTLVDAVFIWLSVMCDWRSLHGALEERNAAERWHRTCCWGVVFHLVTFILYVLLLLLLKRFYGLLSGTTRVSQYQKPFWILLKQR